ncbi:long-chain fatty acid--CoA ligase [Bacillaceae bacterium]
MAYGSKPWLKHYPENVREFSHIPEISMSQFLTRSVQRFAGRTALTFYQSRWSFREVYASVQKFAAALHAAGFKKGDRLAIMLPNCPPYIFSLFGTFQLGGIVVQVNPMYVERELEYILKDSGAETIVVLEALYPRVKAVQRNTALKKVIAVGLGKRAENLEAGDVSFEDFLQSASAPAPEAPIAPKEDVAVLQYTGGTTGKAKGAMLTHYNLVANMEQTHDFMVKTVELPENAKAFNVLPMFHIYGLTCVTFLGLRAGFNQIILPRFEAREVMETVKRELPHLFPGVPTMYLALLAQPDLERYGFEAIKYFNSGGAAMPVEQLHLFEKRVKKKLREGYGLSEASPVTHFNPPFCERKAGSIGIPVPGTEARIVDLKTGTQEVPPGEAGELCVRGPQVMKGYWNMPEETAKALRDGWLYTGDIARMDEDGYFYIIDRKKDLIIASGYNIYPREVEEVLYQHQDVVEAIVIGIPDRYRGETVKAFVTKKKGSSLTEQDLLAHCRKHLAAYKVPRYLEFRDELPRSAVGKLLRRVLLEEEGAKE